MGVSRNAKSGFLVTNLAVGLDRSVWVSEHVEIHASSSRGDIVSIKAINTDQGALSALADPSRTGTGDPAETVFALFMCDGWKPEEYEESGGVRVPRHEWTCDQVRLPSTD